MILVLNIIQYYYILFDIILFNIITYYCILYYSILFNIIDNDSHYSPYFRSLNRSILRYTLFPIAEV